MNLDINALQAQYEQSKEERGAGGGFLENFVKMPEGKGSVILRLMPPAPAGMFGRDKNPFYQWTRIHRVNNKSLHDPREQVNGKWVGDNPIGDYLRWLWKESEKSPPAERDRMQNLYRELKPIERYYYNVIVRSETAEDGTTKTNVGPKILSVGKTVHQLILKGIVGDKELGEAPLGDVTDFKTGRDFKLIKTIRKSGDRSYPNYDGSHFLEESPAGTPEECKAWMENLHDIVALRVLKSAEELEHELQVHLGVKTDTDTNFDPSKFQKEQTSTSVSVTAEVTTEDEEESTTTQSATSTPEASAPTSDSSDADEGGEVLADDEFLEELRNMG